MSEGFASVYQDTSEPRETEMAAASCTQGRRSFLPLKRKTSDHPTSLEELEDISDYPCSKRFLNEELMASHLEHLKLSHEGQAVHYTPSSSNTRQLSIKTVASCPHSTESKVARKRCLTDLSPELETKCEGFKGDYEGFKGDYGSPPSQKRIRICTDTKMPRESVFLHSTKDVHTKCVVSPNRPYDTDMMRTPMHSVGSISDLSSIPEETELSRQSSSFSCDSPTPDTNSVDSCKQKDHQSFSVLHLNPHPPMSSAFLSPSPATTPLASSVDLGTEPCSVWIAPELRAIHAHSNSVLPVSIMNEIKSKELALVPWVGLDTLLQGQEETSDNELSPVPDSAQTVANPQSHDQSHDYDDSGMELN